MSLTKDARVRDEDEDTQRPELKKAAAALEGDEGDLDAAVKAKSEASKEGNR